MLDSGITSINYPSFQKNKKTDQYFESIIEKNFDTVINPDILAEQKKITPNKKDSTKNELLLVIGFSEKPKGRRPKLGRESKKAKETYL